MFTYDRFTTVDVRARIRQTANDKSRVEAANMFAIAYDLERTLNILAIPA
ncbi:hypothetical protein [Sphingomonas sanxanigenens]|uniref:Uncharacterized protein n=1 Tax=Sphingomonas sanxanigenens DSM 19645 = NX02 TaxID=1123269 RepID=W0A9J9_9SPHN|nr:hypothetical protein [Sphingomonas sanxanigenens]AHE52983.1 hypothetical protein NX02_06265 [Sphingomonas sanxanigenens DSM 19645 = NX02]